MRPERRGATSTSPIAAMLATDFLDRKDELLLNGRAGRRRWVGLVSALIADVVECLLEGVVGRNIEEFELLNTRSQLR